MKYLKCLLLGVFSYCRRHQSLLNKKSTKHSRWIKSSTVWVDRQSRHSNFVNLLSSITVSKYTPTSCLSAYLRKQGNNTKRKANERDQHDYLYVLKRHFVTLTTWIFIISSSSSATDLYLAHTNIPIIFWPFSQCYHPKCSDCVFFVSKHDNIQTLQLKLLKMSAVKFYISLFLILLRIIS